LELGSRPDLRKSRPVGCPSWQREALPFVAVTAPTARRAVGACGVHSLGEFLLPDVKCAYLGDVNFQCIALTSSALTNSSGKIADEPYDEFFCFDILLKMLAACIKIKTSYKIQFLLSLAFRSNNASYILCSASDFFFPLKQLWDFGTNRQYFIKFSFKSWLYICHMQSTDTHTRFILFTFFWL
jgi:hypothetical protein